MEEDLGNQNPAQEGNQPSDEQMSMSIVNLQAMLNIEDLDQVIELLKQNNWDESQAANAFYAQQMSGQGGAPPQNEEFKMDENGQNVRAAIDQQEDQLIGGPEDNPFANLFAGLRPQSADGRLHGGPRDNNVFQDDNMGDPFIRRANSMPRIRQREVRPQDFRLTTDIPYDQLDVLDDQEGSNMRAYNQRTWRSYFGAILSTMWYTIKTVITLGGYIAPTGYEQQDFGCGMAIQNDERLLAALDIDPEKLFFKSCQKARVEKKPVLLLVITNPDDESQIGMVIQQLAENSPLVAQIIQEKYELIVLSQEQLETKLKGSSEFVRVSPADDINLFILFVKAENEIAVMRRIQQEDIVSAESLINVLQEHTGLFDILAEEDPMYRRIQILQDAGIIPVQPPQQFEPVQQHGRRPRGVSDNIPQEVIDEMLREQENIDNQNNQQPSQPFQQEVIQPRQEAPAEVIPEEPPKIVKKMPPVDKMPEEPAKGDEGALELVFRLPAGTRINRMFLKDDKIGLLYNFINVLQTEGKCNFDEEDDDSDGTQRDETTYTDQYQIIQTRPRSVYSDKDVTLESVGFFPRGAMLVVQKSEEEE